MRDTPVLEISRLQEIFEDDTAGIADLLEAAMGTGAGHQSTAAGRTGARCARRCDAGRARDQGQHGEYRRATRSPTSRRGSKRRRARSAGTGSRRRCPNSTRLTTACGRPCGLSRGGLVNSNTNDTPNQVLVVDDVQTNLTLFSPKSSRRFRRPKPSASPRRKKR